MVGVGVLMLLVSWGGWWLYRRRAWVAEMLPRQRPGVCVLRDYHAENIMLLGSLRTQGLLDFQDALIAAFPSSSGEKVPPTYKYFVDIVNILRDMRPEKLTDKSILCGSPQHIVDTLKQVEAAGVAEVILYFNYGQKPHAMVKEQMQRFMLEVAPHFA